jgi:FO synthase
MNESISRAAGAVHGQEMPPAKMQELIRAAGRMPKQRTTLYGDVSTERISAGIHAGQLEEICNTPTPRRALKQQGTVAPGRC